jgi:integrase
MSKRTPGLYRRSRSGGRHEWHIDKCIKGYGRICESTGTDDEEEAKRYLENRIKEIRNAVTYGVRPRRTFRQAATKYLETYSHKPGIGRQATAILDLDPFIGDKCIDSIYNETFESYIKARRNPPEPEPGQRRRKPHKLGTVNRNLGVARRILNCCARLWRHKDTGLTWLAQAPLIQLLDDPDARPPYPLDWGEERLMFGELDSHLQPIAKFMINAGPRDQECCGLKWDWEVRVPELDSNGIERTVFLLPAKRNKNKQPRVLMLNDVAQAIIEEMRGKHPVYVFTWVNSEGVRDRIGRLRNSGWVNARRRAASKYFEEFGEPAPKGFERLRVHDLRHTFGRRLRAAGVSKEDRKDLLGHKSRDVTTDYSAVELQNLLEAVNRITKSRKSPAPTVLRLVA